MRRKTRKSDQREREKEMSLKKLETFKNLQNAIRNELETSPKPWKSLKNLQNAIRDELRNAGACHGVCLLFAAAAKNEEDPKLRWVVFIFRLRLHHELCKISTKADNRSEPGLREGEREKICIFKNRQPNEPRDLTQSGSSPGPVQSRQREKPQ